MYFDTKPCAVCGSEVRLRSRDEPVVPEADGPVGEPDGVVGDADSTVDERICTTDDCTTNQTGATATP